MAHKCLCGADSSAIVMKLSTPKGSVWIATALVAASEFGEWFATVFVAANNYGHGLFALKLMAD